jgi:hypothetical protein
MDVHGYPHAEPRGTHRMTFKQGARRACNDYRTGLQDFHGHAWISTRRAARDPPHDLHAGCFDFSFGTEVPFSVILTRPGQS